MAMQKGKFPKTIFVSQENLGEGENEFMQIHADEAEGLEPGEEKHIATYELKEVRRGSLTPQFKN